MCTHPAPTSTHLLPILVLVGCRPFGHGWSMYIFIRHSLTPKIRRIHLYTLYSSSTRHKRVNKHCRSGGGAGGGAAWQETLMSCTCEEECASKGKQSHTQPLQPALCNWFNPHRDIRSIEQQGTFLRTLHRLHACIVWKTMFGSNCQLHKVDRELWIKISTQS